MKKGILRSFAFVCVLLTVFTVLPVANAKAVDETEISPRYTGISKITAGLTINAGGYAHCLGEVRSNNDGEGQYSRGVAYRSALVVNINTNTAYLITAWNEVTVKNFRLAIMDNFSISEGDPDIWKGILLDGGGSTQLYGSDVHVSSERKIPQMIALANN